MSRYLVSFFVIALLQTACVQTPQQHSASRQNYTTLVKGYMDGVNRRDLKFMAQSVSDDVRWLSVNWDKMAMEVSGRDDLLGSLEQYFDDAPSVR